MNTQDFKYAVGDLIKTRKMLHLEHYEGKPMIVVKNHKTHGYNEYKVIVCGYENQFRYFLEDDIEGKYE